MSPGLFQKKYVYNVATRNQFVASVRLLGSESEVYESYLQLDTTGRQCVDFVASRIGLINAEYVDLQLVTSGGYLRWLQPKQPVLPQVRELRQVVKEAVDAEIVLHLAIRYFAVSLHILEADKALRDLFYRQLKSDFRQGRLDCSFEQAFLLAAYIWQVEYGDSPVETTTDEYNLKAGNILPVNGRFTNNAAEGYSVEFGARLERRHKELVRMDPLDATLHFIFECQRLTTYGMEYFRMDNTVVLGVGSYGIATREGDLIQWDDITDLSYTRRFLTITISGQKKSMSFALDSPDTAKYVKRLAQRQREFISRHKFSRPPESQPQPPVTPAAVSIVSGGTPQLAIVVPSQSHVPAIARPLSSPSEQVSSGHLSESRSDDLIAGVSASNLAEARLSNYRSSESNYYSKRASESPPDSNSTPSEPARPSHFRFEGNSKLHLQQKSAASAKTQSESSSSQPMKLPSYDHVMNNKAGYRMSPIQGRAVTAELPGGALHNGYVNGNHMSQLHYTPPLSPIQNPYPGAMAQLGYQLPGSSNMVTGNVAAQYQLQLQSSLKYQQMMQLMNHQRIQAASQQQIAELERQQFELQQLQAREAARILLHQQQLLLQQRLVSPQLLELELETQILAQLRHNLHVGSPRPELDQQHLVFKQQAEERAKAARPQRLVDRSSSMVLPTSPSRLQPPVRSYNSEQELTEPARDLAISPTAVKPESLAPGGILWKLANTTEYTENVQNRQKSSTQKLSLLASAHPREASEDFYITEQERLAVAEQEKLAVIQQERRAAAEQERLTAAEHERLAVAEQERLVITERLLVAEQEKSASKRHSGLSNGHKSQEADGAAMKTPPRANSTELDISLPDATDWDSQETVIALSNSVLHIEEERSPAESSTDPSIRSEAQLKAVSGQRPVIVTRAEIELNMEDDELPSISTPPPPPYAPRTKSLSRSHSASPRRSATSFTMLEFSEETIKPTSLQADIVERHRQALLARTLTQTELGPIKYAALNGLGTTSHLPETEGKSLSEDTLVSMLTTKLENGGLFSEYVGLQRRVTADSNTALLKENRPRNRTFGYTPYDKNRVKLKPVAKNKTGYVNASHVNLPVGGGSGTSPVTMAGGRGGELNMYILAQAPAPAAVVDFWQLVWEQEVQLSALLEEEAAGCYPLTKGESDAYGPDFIVRHFATNQMPNYRTVGLNVKHIPSQKQRKLWLFVYSDWAECNCPANVDAFLSFLDEFISMERHLAGEVYSYQSAPLLIHCRTGAVRSSLFVILHVLRHSLLRYNSFESGAVPSLLARLRDQRAYAVKSFCQYEFIYKAISSHVTTARLI